MMFQQAVLAASLLFSHAVTVAAFVPLSKGRTTALPQLQATVEKDAIAETASQSGNDKKTFFSNIMAANRAEIAVRIMRAATEMNAGTVAIYVKEDQYSQHRWASDRSFLLEKAEGATPISAYLDIQQIIQIVK